MILKIASRNGNRKYPKCSIPVLKQDFDLKCRNKTTAKIIFLGIPEAIYKISIIGYCKTISESQESLRNSNTKSV